MGLGLGLGLGLGRLRHGRELACGVGRRAAREELAAELRGDAETRRRGGLQPRVLVALAVRSLEHVRQRERAEALARLGPAELDQVGHHVERGGLVRLVGRLPALLGLGFGLGLEIGLGSGSGLGLANPNPNPNPNPNLHEREELRLEHERHLGAVLAQQLAHAVAHLVTVTVTVGLGSRLG